MNGTDNMQTSEPATVVHTLKLNWWLLALRGLVAVLFGVLAFMWPGATLITLVWLFGAFALVNGILSLGLLILIAAWAIVTGIMELVAAVRLRKIINNEWLLVLAGIASVVFGVILLFQPAAGALVLIWWIGAWALLSGILLMILAFRMRNWKGLIAVGTAGV